MSQQTTKDFFWLPIAIGGLIGTPSILDLATLILKGNLFGGIVEWIVQGYRNVTAILDGAVLMVVPKVDLNPTWKPVFVLSMLLVSSVSRKRWITAGPFDAVVYFTTTSVMVFIASVVSGMIQNEVMNVLAASGPLVAIFLGSNIPTATEAPRRLEVIERAFSIFLVFLLPLLLLNFAALGSTAATSQWKKVVMLIGILSVFAQFSRSLTWIIEILGMCLAIVFTFFILGLIISGQVSEVAAVAYLMAIFSVAAFQLFDGYFLDNPGSWRLGITLISGFVIATAVIVANHFAALLELQGN